MAKLYQVYRNLNNGKVGIRDKRTQRVVGYASNVQLRDCTFKVTGKNAHAYLEGQVSEAWGFVSKNGAELEITPEDAYTGMVRVERVYYNPCEHDIFYTLEDGDEKVGITHADNAVMSRRGTILAIHNV